jgi:phosphoglycerol transferase MdoB-like AlkP superfamily enzyme
LIYANGFIKPARFSHIGYQVDIIPTILDILQIPAVHSSMGTSLLEKEHFAVVSDGTIYGIFNNDFVLVSDLERLFGLYDYRKERCRN